MPVVNAAATARRIERALQPHANKARSEFFTEGYAPSRLRCFGVAVPKMREVVREFSRELKSASPRDIIAIALALVKNGWVEGRQAGYELIERRPDAMALLTPALIKRLGRGNDNWASV